VHAGADEPPKMPAYLEIITGRRRGIGASLLRGLLGVAAGGYRGIIGARNGFYDYLRMPDELPIPVISVGNLTVGGTGKTPMAIWLCHYLCERGLKPAVLSRGYKADQEGFADEMLVVSRRCPQAVAVAHRNRPAAGRLAIEQYGVNVAVLDDGFQHRRLFRDLDIVLIDATNPFGFGHILPRGLLREPIKSLARADMIVLTRCNQGDEGMFEQIERTVRLYNDEAPLLRSFHRPVGLTDLAGCGVPPPDGARVGALAGIARPDTFADTLTRMHLPPAATFWLDDHHVYQPAEADALADWARTHHLDVVLTTEKDAVKLKKLGTDWPMPILVVRIDVEFVGDGAKILADRIEAILPEEAHPEKRKPSEQP